MIKAYLITWKTNSGFQHVPSLIRGNSFPEAMKINFHHDAIDAVRTYEEVTPYFLHICTSAFVHALPVTVYYTKHGDGKIYIKWVEGQMTDNIRQAIREVSTLGLKHMNEVATAIYSRVV